MAHYLNKLLLNQQGPGYRHPGVVVQENVFNRSNINTVVVRQITSNLARANSPGKGVELLITPMEVDAEPISAES